MQSIHLYTPSLPTIICVAHSFILSFLPLLQKNKLFLRRSSKHPQNQTNRILAHVRPGGNRSLAHFNTLCTRITEGWERIVVGNEKGDEKERELRAVFVLGTIIAGWEVGFSLPAVCILYLSIFPSFLSIFWS